jgi:hypothetical protein
MTTQELELSSDLANYNTVKECIIDALVREDFITEKQGDFIKSGYAVVLIKDNWFGKTIAKLINRPATVIKIVKIV